VQFDFVDNPPRRVRAESDDDGAFEITFPVPGEWRPAVWLTSEVRLPPVEIRSPHDEELMIELPGGRLEAHVLGADGKPVPAAVHLRRADRYVAGGLTDDDGQLELFGLDGEYAVTAESEEGFAGPVAVVIDDDKTAEVELRISAMREVTGQIVSSDGSAASGAIVRSLDDVTRSFDETIADARGMYSIRVKPGTTFLDLIVLAPPHPIAFRRIPVATGRTSRAPQITLAATGAILRVPPTGNVPPWPTVTAPTGRAYSLALLLAPRFGTGPIRELAGGVYQFHVEAGPYTICNPDNECRSALLTPNAETLIGWAGKP
jgi:hypothetical protein